MNRAILIGRLTSDPTVREAPDIKVARYTLAVDRKFKRDGEQTADFITCVAFKGGAEFAGKYLKKGMKIAVVGRIQTGSYTDKDGRKVYTTDVIVEDQEFVESKKAAEAPEPMPTAESFVQVPDDVSELPFN